MTSATPLESPLQKAIRLAGGQSALGRAIGKTQSTVHSWLARSGRVPAEQVFAVANATGMTVAELRPDLVQPESNPARDSLGQPPLATPEPGSGGPSPVPAAPPTPSSSGHGTDTALAGVRS